MTGKKHRAGIGVVHALFPLSHLRQNGHQGWNFYV